MPYDPNQYCDAVNNSGFTSDYTRMAPIQQLPTYTNNFEYNSVFNYTGVGTVGTPQQPNGLLGAAVGIFSAIGSVMQANDQAKAQQQYQMMQYQAYRNQSEQLAQQQQQKQFMESMKSMVEMAMMTKALDNPDFLKKLTGQA